ncbi:hypothetical protein ACPPVT_07080 [Angustibacter sp. McL0619]|uniref:hypothetical protein n=1 Tax=Angustibacter sp. McL0619 TaxID=3415676 RepID=UPI003CE9271F
MAAAASQFGTPQNQFGTPHGQFGTPQNQFGTPQPQPIAAPAQFGVASMDPSWAPPPFAPKASRRRLGTFGGVGVTILVVLLKLVVFGYFLSDSKSPIDLPASVAGMAQSSDAQAQSTFSEALRRELNGHVYGVAVYTDPAGANMIGLMGARGHRSKNAKESLPGPYTKFGKVTCAMDRDQEAIASGTASVDVAVCWRDSRTLTVMAFATGTAPTQMPNAAAAVSAAWDAN